MLDIGSNSVGRVIPLHRDWSRVRVPSPALLDSSVFPRATLDIGSNSVGRVIPIHRDWSRVRVPSPALLDSSVFPRAMLDIGSNSVVRVIPLHRDWSRVRVPSPALFIIVLHLPEGCRASGVDFRQAHVAQSVEHFLGKEEVTGSSPVVSSKTGCSL